MKKLFLIMIVSIFVAVVLLQGGFGAWGEKFDGSVDIIAADLFPNERKAALEQNELSAKQVTSDAAICINDGDGTSADTAAGKKSENSISNISNALASNRTEKTATATTTTTTTVAAFVAGSTGVKANNGTEEKASEAVGEATSIGMSGSLEIRMGDSISDSNIEVISEAAVELETKPEKE